MKLGIGLPNAIGPDLTRGFFLDWCRAADEAGFHVGGTIDRPSYDSWDPLASLAIAAGVTERLRLATTILQLPNRNEVLVAKQAAVIDRVSGGRLDLGLAVGKREADFKVFGARLAKRGKKMERQVRKIRRIWRAAKRSTAEEGITGPAPLQKPLPPIWLGGASEAAVTRAVEFGDGYVFGAVGPETVVQRAPVIRGMLDEKKTNKYQMVGVAWFALGDDPHAALQEGTTSVLRYYGGELPREAERMILHGPAHTIAQTVEKYRSDLDVLILFPTIADLKQLEIVAEEILPAYRVPSA